jgi:hypothetical protein
MIEKPAPQLPLNFGLGPDVILRAYQRWTTGTFDESATRDFAVFRINQVEPFFAPPLEMMAGLVEDWHVPQDSIDALRELPSLNSFEDGFWAELAALRFEGSIDAARSGTVLGGVPVHVSEQARPGLGELADDPPLSIMRISGSAVVIELISEGLLAIMDHSIHHSREVVRAVRSDGPAQYFRSEREIHPILGLIDAHTEFIGGVPHPLNNGKPALYLWVGTQRELAKELPEFSKKIEKKLGVPATVMAI